MAIDHLEASVRTPRYGAPRVCEKLLERTVHDEVDPSYAYLWEKPRRI